jgi:hypothetical protein
MRAVQKGGQAMVAMMTEMMGWPTMRLRKTRSTQSPRGR